MEESQTPGRISDDHHALNVDRTLKELQRIVAEHERSLTQLRDDAPHVSHAGTPSTKESLDVMTEAYETLSRSEPFLPFQDSVLPALIALRKTHATIHESEVFGKSQGVSLDAARRRLEVEEANLADQRMLRKALEQRVQSLRSGLETAKNMTPEQVYKKHMEALRDRKREYDRDTSKLLKALNQFIHDHLGAMLAAEELGGPVVGGIMDVDADSLEAGFNAQGKAKKTKSKASIDEDKRQQRIDGIWGAIDSLPDRRKRSRDEAAAAGAGMRDLTEELLNNMMQSNGDNSAAYVKIAKETAAARFLVRSKVAQFHPRDATRIRLVDFGRELED